MPRPVKCRKVCHFPNVLEFLPADDTEKKMPIVLTVDEYETIRLLDKKGYSQEQCAASMQVARTTVQRIYEIARKKIADALIDGHPSKLRAEISESVTVRAATAALEDVTNRKFTKNMQQKKEKVS